MSDWDASDSDSEPGQPDDGMQTELPGGADDEFLQESASAADGDFGLCQPSVDISWLDDPVMRVPASPTPYVPPTATDDGSVSSPLLPIAQDETTSPWSSPLVSMVQTETPSARSSPLPDARSELSSPPRSPARLVLSSGPASPVRPLSAAEAVAQLALPDPPLSPADAAAHARRVRGDVFDAAALARMNRFAPSSPAYSPAPAAAAAAPMADSPPRPSRAALAAGDLFYHLMQLYRSAMYNRHQLASGMFTPGIVAQCRDVKRLLGQHLEHADRLLYSVQKQWERVFDAIVCAGPVMSQDLVRDVRARITLDSPALVERTARSLWLDMIGEYQQVCLNIPRIIADLFDKCPA